MNPSTTHVQSPKQDETLKVLFFDSWTQGSVNILPLLSAFKQLKMNPMLIHVGSWGHETGRPDEERIGGLLARDIRYYKGKPFREILTLEGPDVVVFLSTRAYAHRAFNRYCKQQRIPTVHVFHGIHGIQDFSAGRFGYLGDTRFLKQLSRIVTRLWPNITTIGPTYLRALIETGAGFGEWLLFVRNVADQLRGRLGWAGAPDSSTSAACVYTDAEIDVGANWYHVPREAVHAVGNPDLVKFGLSQGDLGACLSSSNNNVVVYIETALLQVTNIYLSSKELLEHFLGVRNALAKQGCKLKVKLHPVHYSTGFPDQLTAEGIELCTDRELVPEIKKGAVVISEPSSVVLLPALLGAKVLLAQFGKLRGLKYSASLLRYPYAKPLESIDGFRAAVDTFGGNVGAASVLDWIRHNAGPIPAGDMPLRVAKVVFDVAVSARKEPLKRPMSGVD